MARQSEQVLLDSQFSTRWKFHNEHRDIHKDFQWEEQAGAVLWSALRLDSVDRKATTHSKIQIGLVDLRVRTATDVEPLAEYLEPKTSLVYVAIET